VSQFLNSLPRERKEGFQRLTFLWEKAQLFCSWSRQQKMWESLDYAATVFTEDSMPFNSLLKSDKSHQFQMLKIAASVFM